MGERNTSTLVMFIITLSLLVSSLPIQDAFAEPPVADDQLVSTDEDVPVNITLTASDSDGDTLTFSIDSGPTNGILTGTAPDVTYTPDANYNGPDSFTFSANDGTSDSNTATVSITVNAVNDAPVVDAGPDATINQGDTFSFSGSFTDDDTADPWTATVDYGDGMGVQSLPLDGKTFELSHLYDQDIFTLNGGFPFEVIVTISDGTVDSVDTVLVTVNNTPPTIAPIDDVTIDQGESININGMFTDPDADTWFAEVNFGGSQPASLDSDSDGLNDATENAGPSIAFPTCTSTDINNKDSDGDGLTDGEEVLIFSTNPCVPDVIPVTGSDSDGDGLLDSEETAGPSDVFPACTTNETERDTDNDGLTDGEEVLIFGTNPCDNDTDDDLILDGAETYDGIDVESVVLEADKTFSLSHTFLEAGEFLSTISIRDGPIDSDEESFTVFVTNIAPVISSITGDTIDEGDLFTTSGSFVDPGNDPWEVTVDYGDGTDEEIILFDETSPPSTTRTFELLHVYTNDGTFTVVITVDDGTTSDSESFDVVVENVVPIVEIEDGDLPILIEEGDEFFSFGRVTDPGTESVIISTVDYGDGDGPEPLAVVDNAFSLEHTYENDGLFDVTVSYDDGSGPVTDVASVIVSNVKPEISLGMSMVDDDRLFTVTGSFTDPGADTWSATVDYDDGTGVQLLPLDGKTFELSHQYSENDAYNVKVIVTDDDDFGKLTSIISVFVSDTAPLPELNLPPASLASISDDVHFQKNAQNMWPGTSGMKQWDVFPEQRWNEADSDGAFETLAGATFGGSIGGSTNGILKGFAKATELQGTANINYPGSLEVEYGAPRTFLAGQDVPIKPKWTLDTSPGGASINNAKTLGNLELFLKLKVFAGFDTNICVFGCIDLFGFIPNVNFDTGNVKLFDFNVADTVTNTPPPLIAGHLLGSVDPMFGPISVSPVTTSKDANTGRIVAKDKNTFSSMNLDLDAIITGGAFPSLSDAVEDELKSAIMVTLEHEVLDAKSPIEFIAEQTLIFDTNILVKFDFVPPVAGVMGTTLNVVGNDVDGISSITTMKGEQLTVKFPLGQTEPTTVTTTVFLDPAKTQLRNVATVGTMSQIDVSMLTAGIGIPSFTIIPAIPIYNPVPHLSGWECHGFLCTSGHFHHGPHWHLISTTPAVKFPGVNFGIGPLFEFGPFAELMTTVNVADKTIPLDVTGDVIPLSTTFMLIPEIPPTADADGPYTVDEGSIVLLDGSGSTDDGSPEPLTHKWDLDDDGLFETPGESVDFFGVDGPALHKVTLQVFDGLNFGTDSSSVTVLNVAPSVSAGDDATVDEGSLFARSGTFEDPGKDTWDATVDWGDGTAPEPITLSPSVGPALPDPPAIPGTFDIEHIYADNGEYTVTVTVTDDDGGVGSDSFVVTVENIAPTVDVGDNDLVDEGTLYPYTATFTDPGFDCSVCITAEDFTAIIDWGDNTGVESLTIDETPGSPSVLTEGTASGSHTFADDGDYTVTVTVTDDDGGVDVDTFVITVNNVVPTLDAGADKEYVIHDVTSLDPATYSDPGFDCSVCITAEDFTATVNWGEGDPDEPLIVGEVPGSPGVLTIGTASGEHIYRFPGEYTVTVTVIDDDTGTTSDTLVNTILGAQDLKKRAISFLEPFEGESQRVVKALEHINKSLEEDLWIDEVYLDSQQGHRVYDEERNAVQQLQQLLNKSPDEGKGNSPSASPELRQAAQDAIDLLVNADRVLAITLMLDSDTATSDKSNFQKNIDREHATAEDEFAKGDAARDAGDYDNAIQHYRKAWEHAQLALKFAS